MTTKATARKPRPKKKAAHVEQEHHSPAPEHTTEDVFSAFRNGRADAVEAAKNTLPVIKKSVSKGTYMTCYYLAFAAVYSAELVMAAVPEDSVIRSGFKDGASAAKDVYSQRQSAHEEELLEPEPA